MNTTIEDLIKDLRAALATANELKTGERTEEQRRLAILCTEMEKVVAWALYVAT